MKYCSICDRLCCLNTGTSIILFLRGSSPSIPFTFIRCTKNCVIGISNGRRISLNCNQIIGFTVTRPCTPQTNTFTNALAITIPETGTEGPASPYPSPIIVTGLTGPILKVTVTFNNLSHTYPGDISALLVGPGGETVILMATAGDGFDVENVTLTFDDAAPAQLPENDQIVSGTYQPTNYGIFTPFTSPAPDPPYGATLSVFNRTNPNGQWNLFIFDQFAADIGSMAGGWTLTITSCEPGTGRQIQVQQNNIRKQRRSSVLRNVVTPLTEEERARKQRKAASLKLLKSSRRKRL